MPVAESRRRMRVAYTIVWVVIATNVVVPALLERHGIHVLTWVVAGIAIPAFLLPLVFTAFYDASQPVRHGPGFQLLTGTTTIGTRTVDLRRLRRVRRVRIQVSRFGSADRYWISDRRGVALAVDRQTVLDIIGQPGPPGPPPPVTTDRHAAVGLGLTTPGRADRIRPAAGDWFQVIVIVAVLALSIATNWIIRHV